MRQITIVGNLTKDPDQPREAGSSKVANFRVATNGMRDDDLTIYFKCAVWGNRTNGLKYMRKGQQVTVTGRLYMDEWQDKETGETMRDLCIDVSDYSLPPKGEPAGAGNGRYENEAPF